MHGVRERQLAQEAAARLGDDADRRQVADVGAARLDQEAVHRRVEVRVVHDVVDVAVVVVVVPAGGDGAQHAEVAAVRRLRFPASLGVFMGGTVAGVGGVRKGRSKHAASTSV